MVGLTCAADVTPEPGARIFNSSSQEQSQTQDSVGKIVCSAISGNQFVMLAVLQKSALHSTDSYIDTPETTPAKTVVAITRIFDPQDHPQ
jgi:hypothetical protein